MKTVFEYDVALSFAGEDRAFVEACAEILRALNVNVFYDNYEKEILLGKNLYSYLADIYQNRAHFAVVFVSKAYKEKRWTKHELEYITARKFHRDDEYHLPIKLDDTELNEIPLTTGYLQGNTPLNVAISLLSPFRMVCRDFILPESANYVYFYPFFCATYSTLSVTDNITISWI